MQLSKAAEPVKANIFRQTETAVSLLGWHQKIEVFTQFQASLQVHEIIAWLNNFEVAHAATENSKRLQQAAA